MSKIENFVPVSPPLWLVVEVAGRKENMGMMTKPFPLVGTAEVDGERVPCVIEIDATVVPLGPAALDQGDTIHVFPSFKIAAKLAEILNHRWPSEWVEGGENEGVKLSPAYYAQ